jgi:glycosyltransferase involved in cell wall biosynthesis
MPAAPSPFGARKLRAGFVCAGDPRDIDALSGTPHQMFLALARHFELVAVIERPWPRWFVPLGRVLRAATFGRHDPSWSTWYTRLGARGALARLWAADPDVVFAVLVSPMAHLLTGRCKVIHVSDTTLRAMSGYYAEFTRLCRAAGPQRVEAKTIRGAWLALYPSEWARRSAIADYGALPDRAIEIAWGANIAAVAGRPRRLPDDLLRFLFIGTKWRRKGGQIAVDTVRELTARGIRCRLDIVGCRARVLRGPPPANVVFHGRLDKSTAPGAELLGRLYADATFLLLPTQAECYGIAFAEAAHYGLPSIGTTTGGVPSVVRDGVTGILLPPGASATTYADAVAALIASPERYEGMSQAALNDAAERLNWRRWAEEVHAAVSRRWQA